MRVYVYIKHPYLLKINKEIVDEEKNMIVEEIVKYDNSFNYVHLVVFENQLISPQSHDFSNYGFDDW